MPIREPEESAPNAGLVTHFELVAGDEGGEVGDGEVGQDLGGVDTGEVCKAGIDCGVVDGEEGGVVGETDVEKLKRTFSLMRSVMCV